MNLIRLGIYRRAVFAAVASVALANSASSVSAQTIQDFFNKVLPSASQPARSGGVAGRQTAETGGLSMTGIASVQTLLGRLGYDAGTADGVAGRRTRSAMNQFQREHGLPETQVPDQATLDALRAAVSTAEQRPTAPPEEKQTARAGPTAIQPGFDCRLASTQTERAICGSMDLSRMDRDVSTIYAAILEMSGEAARATERDAQRGFISTRNACGADAYCLFPAYLERLGAIKQSASQAGLLVTTGPEGTTISVSNALASPITPDDEPAQIAHGSDVIDQSEPVSQTEVVSAPAIPTTPSQSPINDLALLRSSHSALIPWDIDTFQGVPLLSNWQFLALTELVQAAPDPGRFIAGDECSRARRFFTADALRAFANPIGCVGSGLNWHGDNEFARAEARSGFYRTLPPLLSSISPELPMVVAIADDAKLSTYNEQAGYFPLQLNNNPDNGLLENLFASSSRAARFAGLSISSLESLPPMVLPVKNMSSARDLLEEVNSWPYAYAGSTARPRTGLRMVKRVAVVEIANIDIDAKRMDIRLDSLGIYSLDLARALHTYPRSASVGAIVFDGLPATLRTPEPVALDLTYALMRQIGEQGGDAPDDLWKRLHQAIGSRDTDFYASQSTAGENSLVLSSEDARRPFFGRGDYSLPDSRIPLFKEWAANVARGLPEIVVHDRRYGHSNATPGKTYRIPAFSSASDRYGVELEALGIQRDRAAVLEGIGDVLFILPNRVEFYAIDLDGAEMVAVPRGEFRVEGRFRADGSVQFIHDGDGKQIALIPLTPLSLALNAEGAAIVERTFDDVPSLDDGFLAAPGSLPQPVFDGPVAMSQSVVNFLTAVSLDAHDPALAGLAVERWHIERAGGALGTPFFARGVRQPSEDEAAAFAEEFSRWVHRHVPQIPDEIVLETDIMRRDIVASDAFAWTNFACMARALTNRDGLMLAENGRSLRTADQQRERANGGRPDASSTWTTANEVRWIALSIDALVSQFVVRFECGLSAAPRLSDNLPTLRAVIPAVLPAAPEEAASARIRLRIDGLVAANERPDYRMLLPAEVLSHVSPDWIPESSRHIRLDADPVEVVYLDGDGTKLTRLSPDAEKRLESALVPLFQELEKPPSYEAAEPYGLDVLGIRVGMSFEQAEALIREHMKVGKILTGIRSFDGTLETGRIRPATSGKLFISEDGMEMIALIDEAPIAEGTVLGAWRRIYLAPNTLAFEDAAIALEDKYGKPEGSIIHQNWRNAWMTADGIDCRGSITAGGERPALSRFWSDQGEPASLDLPGGHPMANAMLPLDMMMIDDGPDVRIKYCGPVLTAELSFNASLALSSGYQTQDLDWIETIITDVGPYMEAFVANREKLAATASGATATRTPAIRF